MEEEPVEEEALPEEEYLRLMWQLLGVCGVFVLVAVLLVCVSHFLL